MGTGISNSSFVVGLAFIFYLLFECIWCRDHRTTSMASQQYFHPSIQPDYKPMYLTGDTIPLYYANAGSQAMNRYQVSNDSTNSSGSSFSVTAMSNGAGSPDSAFYDNDYVYNQSSYLEPSPSTAVSGTGLETLPRETPASLDWCPNSELLKLYKFVVQKSKEPHFELRSEFDITPRTPKKVYLDQPGYILQILGSRIKLILN
jgi:hypothetical protein